MAAFLQAHYYYYYPSLSYPTTTLIIPTTTTTYNVTSSFHNVCLSSTNPSSSLSLHRTFHPIRCSSPILTVESHDSDEVSTTRLLAQNVPWSATVADIRALFQQHGSVLNVELSMHSKTRNRGLAFVEMGSPEEAAEALAKLEAFEFEGRTLKLTYAKPRRKKASPPVQTKPPVLYNLYVANLPYEARNKDVKEFFQSGGSDPFSADVIFYDNPRKASGYGFVSFKTKKEADEALLAFEGKELMGRPIRVARSRRFVKLESEVNPQSEDEQALSADSSQGSDQPEAHEM